MQVKASCQSEKVRTIGHRHCIRSLATGELGYGRRIGGSAGVCAVERDAARKGGGSPKGLTPQVACQG